MNEALVIAALLLVKHFLFDFPFQTQKEIANKGDYFNPAGTVHSYKHGLATMAIFLFFAPWTLALVLGWLDLMTHYHIDWAKMKLSKKLTAADKKFWVYLGLDQLLHQLVYVGLIYLYWANK